MKGLLVKDFCIMKLQKTFFIMIFVMALVFAWSFKNPSYMVSFLTFISSIFVLTTISYDEFDNGYTFLFTLPVSRRIYVLEKYVFGLILGAGTWCVCTVIAAICAAPSILGELGFLKGKKACSYPSFEDKLEGAEVVREPAVTDGNITTGRGMGAAIPFALALVSVLFGAKKAEEVKKAIVYE